MGNTRIIVIILFIMIVLCTAILFVYKQYINKNILDGPGMVYQSKEKTYYAENVLDMAAWLGKTAEEAGIGEEYVHTDGAFLKIAFDGKLLDKAAYGNVYFDYASGNEDVIRRIKTVYIHSKELTYEECKNGLTLIYGEAKDEYEEPYVEVNGGAVVHCDFNGEGYTLRLSKAGNYDYIDLEINAAE